MLPGREDRLAIFDLGTHCWLDGARFTRLSLTLP